MMTKIDFKREYKHLYRPSAKKFNLVDVPAMQFLMIDGHGDPNTAQGYQDAVEALFGVAFKIKFLSKKNWGKITQSCPWKGCGGQTIWMPSPINGTRANGIGR